MSRLMADQENRGGDGEPGAGEEESVMGVNLAEGFGAVNGELAARSSLSCSFGLFGLTGSSRAC
jgi:hypothetical protein